MEELITYCKCACADCGHVIDYRATQAGQIIECPKCGEKSVLPEPPKLEMIEIFGPPMPTFKQCPVCGLEFNFFAPNCPDCEVVRNRKRRETRMIAAACAVVLVFAAGFAARYVLKTAAERRERAAAAAAAADVKPTAPNRSGEFLLIEAPRARAPKSTNDLRPGRFALEQRHNGDIAIAVGDIENISENLHGHLRADLDVLDRSGKKIGSVSDYFNELGPHQRWHFVATVTESNAMSVRFAGVTEQP